MGKPLVSLCLLVSFACSACTAYAQTYPVYRLEGPVTLDGKLTDDAWAAVPAATGFRRLDDAGFSAKQSVFRAGYDRDHLYIGIHADEPAMESLKAGATGGANVWQDDGFEIFLVPEGESDYYQFLFNTAGLRFNTHGGPVDLWDWDVKLHRGRSAYSVEIRIPLRVFGKAPAAGASWKANIVRNILTSAERHSSWSLTGGNFHHPDRFGRFVFKGKPPAKAELAGVEAELNAAFRKDQKRRAQLRSAGRKTHTITLKPMDLGVNVTFDSIRWEATTPRDTDVVVKASSGPLATWGQWLWGTPLSWSALDAVANGKPPGLPPGRHLKVVIEVSAPEGRARPAVDAMVVTYTPVNGQAGQESRQVDLTDIADDAGPVAGIPLTDAIQTPHIKWAQPYARGRIKALFLTHFLAQRGVIELAQRMDLDYATAAITVYPANMGIASPYRGRLSTGAVLADLEKKLETEDYDVIVTCGANWDMFNARIVEQILAKVSQGTGLIVNTDYYQGTKGSHYPNGMPQKVKDILSFREFSPGPTGLGHYQGQHKGTWQKRKDHVLTTGIPFEVLPASKYFRFKSSDDDSILATVNGDPLLGISRHGRGRVVALTYGTSSYWPLDGALAPQIEYDGGSLRYWEYYNSLLIKSLLWAAGKEPLVIIETLRPSKGSIRSADRESESVLLTLNNTTEPADVQVTVSMKDEDDSEHARLTRKIALAQGRNELSFPLPAGLRSGLHLADVIIRNADGKVENWGSTHFTVSRPLSIAGVELDKEVFQPGDTVRAKVSIAVDSAGRDTAGEKAALLVKLIDAYDRVVHLEKKELDIDGPAEVDVAAKLNNVMSNYLRLRCELSQGDDLLDATKRDLAVKLEPRWDDYEINCWLGLSGNGVPAYRQLEYCRRLQDMGIGILLADLRVRDTFALLAQSGSRIIGNNLGRMVWHGYSQAKAQYEKTKDKKFLVRHPDLSDPAYQRQRRDGVQSMAKALESHGLFGYTLGDETSLLLPGTSTFAGPALDISFSDPAVKDFRQWLRGRYGDLQGLNQQWETDFPEWGEVVPMTREEAKARGGDNYSPWADHRTFMEDVFAGAIARDKEALVEVDPFGRIGISGTGPPSAYTGFDYWKLGNVLDYMHMYIFISDGEIWRSLAKGNLTLWSGYGRPTDRQDHYVWWAALHGHTGMSLWYPPMFLKPDLTFYDHARHVKSQATELTEGLGKLLMTARRKHDSIAIHYSQPSIHAAWLSGDEIRHIDDMDALVTYVQAAGLQFNFVSYEQIEQDELAKGGYKVLILPFSKAISVKEAEKIKAFVAAGGLLIADVLPAIMDDHCRLLERGLLDDVFGVHSKAADYSEGVGTVDVDRRAGQTDLDRHRLNDISGVAATELAGGKALARFVTGGKGQDVLVMNEYGKGRAVYFNFFLSNQAANDVLVDQSRFLADILKWGGVRPRIEITSRGQPVGYYEAVFYAGGAMEYVGVLRDYRGGDRTETVQIVFPEKAHVYEMRERRYCGLVKQTTATISPGSAKVYALLGYRVTGVTVDADKVYRRGQTVAYRIGVQAGGDEPGDHIIRVEVYDPQGRLCRHYCRNLSAAGGQGQGQIDLALNEPLGNWKVRATDVVSGTVAETVFEVKQ